MALAHGGCSTTCKARALITWEIHLQLRLLLPPTNIHKTKPMAWHLQQQQQ
jgi:hypothetical protein